jgi:hypothetical protein
MCDQCESLQKTIEQFERALRSVHDRLSRRNIRAGLEELLARKTALHAEEATASQQGG